MANEYTTLATLKLALSITDTDRDTLLNAALAAASRGIDATCGRKFWADTTATARVYRTSGTTVGDCDGEALLVDDISTTTSLVVEVGDGTTWTTVTDYFTEPNNAVVQSRPITRLRRDGGAWSYDRQVRVTAKWGWPAIPDEVAQACLLQAARLFKRRQSPEGIAGNDEFGLIRVSRVDPDVQALLRPYMLPGFG